MRKSSSYKEKLYVHDNGLCVNGDKIELSKIPKPQKCHTNRNIRIESALPREVTDNRHKKPEEGKRKAFGLKVTDCRNLQVCNKQLRQIYGTVEVKDFERILGNLNVSDEFKRQSRSRKRDILDTINADEIYQEFFGQYYSYLKNAMGES